MPYSLTIKQTLFPLESPKVMGILNLTPDSFYAESRHLDLHKQSNLPLILSHVEAMVAEGMDILDIGSVSTRPGAETVSQQEEWLRIKQPLCEIAKHFPNLPISIDTFRSEIAKQCVEEGASMINDISGGLFDPQMLSTVGKLQVPYVLMHTSDCPQLMQKDPQYQNITQDLIYFFSKQLALARQAGIHDVILDPGFGFGKTVEHNYQLLAQLQNFAILDCPLLVGLSRKSMLWKPLESKPDQMLNASTVVNTLALTQGAHILRVHDVQAAVESVKLFNLYHQY